SPLQAPRCYPCERRFCPQASPLAGAAGLAAIDRPLQLARPWLATPTGGLAMANHLCMQTTCMWLPLPRRQRLLSLPIAATSAWGRQQQRQRWKQGAIGAIAKEEAEAGGSSEDYDRGGRQQRALLASLSDGGGGLGRDGMSAAAKEAEGATAAGKSGKRWPTVGGSGEGGGRVAAGNGCDSGSGKGGSSMGRKMVGGVWLLERRVRLQPMQGWQRLCGSDEGCEQKAAVAWGGRRGNRDGSSSRWWGGKVDGRGCDQEGCGWQAVGRRWLGSR
ncbi:hypothetical protein B296_00040854, partial [Ensete ventricosum]